MPTRPGYGVYGFPKAGGPATIGQTFHAVKAAVPAVPAPILNDPCDNFTFAPWTPGGSTAVVAGGKNGNGFRIPTFSSSDLRYNIAAGNQTDKLTIGFWINFTSFPSLSDTPLILASDAGATPHITLHVYSAINALLVFKGSSAASLIQTADNSIALATWTYIELAVTLHDTLGTVTLRINGAVAGTFNGDTKNGGTKTVFDQITFSGGGASGPTMILDDIYIRNDLTFSASGSTAAPTTFSPATWVYQWCKGAWQVIWGAAVVAPASVAAVYLPAGTTARVTWVPPVLNIAASWTVRRADGSIVATVPFDTLTVDDDLPLPGSNAYTVEAVNESSTSARTASAPLTINLQPATVTATYQAPYSAVVSWTPNVAQGAADQWRVYNVTAGMWVSPLLDGSTRSTTVTLTPGQPTTVAVYPFLSGLQGTGRNAAAAVNVQAAPPVNVSVAWEGVKRQITLRWAHGGGVVSAWEVEGYDLNHPVWVGLGSTTSGAFNWSNMSGQGYMRVRATAPGVAPSDWVQVGPVIDATAPIVYQPGLTTGDGAHPIITIRQFSDAQSIDTYGVLQVSFNGSPWADVQQVTSNQGNLSYDIPLANRGQVASFRVVAYDLWNNVGVSAPISMQTKPYGTIQVLATGVDSYTWGVVNAWRGFWIPYSDTQPTNGAWFYGNGWQNACKGFVPDAASILLIKNGSNPAEAGAHNLQLMTNYDYDQSVPPNPVGGGIGGPGMSQNGEFVEFALPEVFRTAMGIGSVHGMLLIDSGGPRRLYGTNLNSNSGRITFTFN